MNTHFNLSCPLMEWYLILVAAATQFEEPSSCIMERWSIKSKKSPINYHYGHFYWNSYRVLLFIWLLSGQSGRAANKNIIQSPGAGGCYPVMVPALVIQLEFYKLNWLYAFKSNLIHKCDVLSGKAVCLECSVCHEKIRIQLLGPRIWNVSFSTSRQNKLF